jgi:FtsH-binding integral membrane protein
MSDYGLQSSFPVAADLNPGDRAQFISRTYSHVAGAVLAFVGIEFLLLNSPAAGLMLSVFGAGKLGLLAVMLGFMGITWLAQKMADDATSLPMQYAGLSLYVVAEAFLFLPLLYIAANYAGSQVIAMAAGITGALFLGLTFVAFTTKKDFSFLGAILKIGGFVALGLIGCSIIFGFQLGLLFAGIMVVFAAASILYSTSNIMFRYGTHQYVAASLSLFASVMLLFFYILRLLMGSRRS